MLSACDGGAVCLGLAVLVGEVFLNFLVRIGVGSRFSRTFLVFGYAKAFCGSIAIRGGSMAL